MVDNNVQGFKTKCGSLYLFTNEPHYYRSSWGFIIPFALGFSSFLPLWTALTTTGKEEGETIRLLFHLLNINSKLKCRQFKTHKINCYGWVMQQHNNCSFKVVFLALLANLNPILSLIFILFWTEQSLNEIMLLHDVISSQICRELTDDSFKVPLAGWSWQVDSRRKCQTQNCEGENILTQSDIPHGIHWKQCSLFQWPAAWPSTTSRGISSKKLLNFHTSLLRSHCFLWVSAKGEGVWVGGWATWDQIRFILSKHCSQ